MRNPYAKLLILSLLLTVLLFIMDRKPLNFTVPSITGYAIVGALYTIAIFVVSSALYFLTGRIRKALTK